MANSLAAGIEVVEGLGDVVDREGEEQGGDRVGARLGVPLDLAGGQGVEIGADGDPQVEPGRPAASRCGSSSANPSASCAGLRLKVCQPWAHPGGPPQRSRRLAADVDGGTGVAGMGLGNISQAVEVVSLAVELRLVLDPSKGAQHLEVLVGALAPARPGRC